MERSGIDPDAEALQHWGHPPHAHAVGQFVTAVTGSGVLRIGEKDCAFDAATAIWVPPGVEHSAMFAPDLLPLAIDLHDPALPADARRVSVNTSLWALTLAWARDDDAHRNADRESRIADAIRSSPSLRSPLRLPKGPLTRPVMEHLRRAPAVAPPLTEWATRLHASVPTIRRAFLAETGTTYSEWTTQFRLELSTDVLRAGGTVAQVARAMGFSPNGYTLAFRRWMGQTPSEYRARVLA
ncbi:helix-turn-helix transcriptional regulator [Microbacterium sp. 2C]|uniref:helix-turn-helix transcriptional regulator n=1 Tax=Micrococcales TaxID=85006 RepID=UPI0018C206DE|nr:AraC family transcriptional regulator [Microbacterium paulum]MBG0717230.1 helix-turn-helix transcriptional regulator [Microbacterium paulum]